MTDVKGAYFDLNGKMLNKPQKGLCALFLFVIPDSDEVAGEGEWIPGNVKPAGAGEELVSQFVRLEEVHEALELAGVLGADVGSLTEEMLRVLDATDEGIDARVAVARIDDDGTDHLAGGLQEHQAAIGHVHHVLHGGNVVGVLAQIEKLAQTKVGRQPRVIELCVFHRVSS